MTVRPICVYVACPLDDLETPMAWAAKLAAEAPTGVLLFTPFGAYIGQSPVTAKLMDRQNRLMILATDGLLANLAGPGRGFGTIREIEFARGANKPVVVVHREDEPLMSLLTHDLDMVYDDPMAGLERLLELIGERRSAPIEIHTPWGIFRHDPEGVDEDE